MQPNLRPTALQTFDDGLAVILMLLRALIMGHLPRRVLPAEAVAAPFWSHLADAAALGHPIPAARPYGPLECVLIAPVIRERQAATPVFGRTPRLRGAVSPHSPTSPPSASPADIRPEPRSHPPPPVLPPNPARHKAPCCA